MQRITLRAILRAVFGAEGAHLRTLEDLIPRWTELGPRVALLPALRKDLGRHSPWGKFKLRRAEIDAELDELIAIARADPDVASRVDVLALMCDLRFAAAGVKFTTAFARRGLIAEHGISWLLPRLVGPARALDLLLSGRVLLTEEAHELGLVNRVLAGEQLLDATLAYAGEVAANCSPASMAAMKRQVYADLECGLDDATAEADQLMLASFARPDFAEGVQSFVERRPPEFAGLAAAG